MVIEHTGYAGQWKIYQDTNPGEIMMGYKGTSYMGSEIVDKDDNPIADLKAGDKFFVRDCPFGYDEYTCHNIDKDAGLTSYGRKIQGDDRTMDGMMGVCERDIIVSIEHDSEHGWLAIGYAFCPHTEDK